MSIQRYFPTQLWQKKLRAPDSLEAIARECRAFRALDDAGRRWSAKNYFEGYTSYSSITDLHHRSTTFDHLRKKIDIEALRFARALDMELQGKTLMMTSFWINIMGKHTHHSFHLHPLSAISGTYYVQVPPDSGVFKIEDPRIQAFMGSPPRKPKAKQENQRYVNLSCKPGEVLLFESWLKHEVPANRSSRERISLSFNYDWV